MELKPVDDGDAIDPIFATITKNLNLKDLTAKCAEARGFLDGLDRSVSRRITRASFDPTRRDHLASYHAFVTTGSWGNVHFCCEYPSETVPETVARRFAIYHLAGFGR